jgi:hypothetical protein
MFDHADYWYWITHLKGFLLYFFCLFLIKMPCNYLCILSDRLANLLALFIQNLNVRYFQIYDDLFFMISRLPDYKDQN